MSIQQSSDFRSNEGDQTVYAAKKIGRSPLKKKIFEAVYFGKQKIKTVSYIEKRTGLKRKRVLEEAKKLVTAKLIHQCKHDGEMAYTRDDDFKSVWKKILNLAGNEKKIRKIPTKTNPSGSQRTLKIQISSSQVKIQQITIDDVGSFEKVKKIKTSAAEVQISENKFKLGLLKIIGENGKPPKDWGGEANDIFTTRLKIGGKRVHAAFALKGPGKKIKKLVPGHMGKNGDQIQRLTASSAQVFFVQYWREIDQSVIDQMRQFALAKSMTEGRKIYFGIIDGSDSARLMKAYKNKFK